MTEFDKRDIYESLIEPKVTELIQLCNKERMPVFITVCVKNDDKDTEYENNMFASASNNIYLKKDRIPDHVNVMNGFSTTPPADIVELEF